MDESDTAPTLPEVGTRDEPYADVDVSDLPEWWQEAIEEFRDHGLRPYKPPRFSDGELKFQTVERLENELDVHIDLVGVGIKHGDEWNVRVDGDVITAIGHRRTPEAYTEFEMSSDEFTELIRDYVSEGD